MATITINNRKLIVREGHSTTCPHCLGKKGKTVLLYYWVDCYLCLGSGKMNIDKIVQIDERHGDIKATYTVNLNNANCPKLVTQTNWLI